MMKRSTLNGTAPAPNEAIASLPKNNGKPKSPDDSLDLNVILAALQNMRNGDFTVRLPGTWVGLPGKIADTFNDIVAANQHMAQDLKRHWSRICCAQQQKSPAPSQPWPRAT